MCRSWTRLGGGVRSGSGRTGIKSRMPSHAWQEQGEAWAWVVMGWWPSSCLLWRGSGCWGCLGERQAREGGQGAGGHRLTKQGKMPLNCCWGGGPEETRQLFSCRRQGCRRGGLAPGEKMPATEGSCSGGLGSYWPVRLWCSWQWVLAVNWQGGIDVRVWDATGTPRLGWCGSTEVSDVPDRACTRCWSEPFRHVGARQEGLWEWKLEYKVCTSKPLDSTW